MPIAFTPYASGKTNPTPVDGSTSNPLNSQFVFDITSTPEVFEFSEDLHDIVVTLTQEGKTPEIVYKDSETQEGYSGSLSRLQGDDITLYNRIIGNFSRASNLLYNRNITITITGTIPYAFTIFYTFETGILSSISPPSSTPVVAGPVSGAQVDEKIAFKVNTNGSPISIVTSSLNVDLIIDGVPVVPSPVAAGVPSVYPWKAEIQSSSDDGSCNVTLTPMKENPPYKKIVRVDVVGTELPARPFVQSFNYETQNDPITLDDISNASLDTKTVAYQSLKDDGSDYQRTFTGSTINFKNSSSNNTPLIIDSITDSTGPFTSLDANKNITIVDTTPGSTNTRTTKILSYNSPEEVLVDIKGLSFVPYLVPSGTITYTISEAVTQSTSQTSSTTKQTSSSALMKSATNSIFLTTQYWAERLHAFRHTFRGSNISLPNSSDWPVNAAATLLSDVSNSAIPVMLFLNRISNGSKGVGFILTIPTGTKGIRLDMTGRSRNSPVATSFTGWTLYYRAIPNGSAVSGWSSMVLNDFVTPDAYYHYTTQSILLSPAFNLTPGLTYVFELVRTVPVALPELNGDFYLHEFSMTFG